MIVFEIRINGEPLGDAETITAATLVAERIQRRGTDRVSIHAGSAAAEDLQWLDAHLRAGDEIVIDVVEVPDEDECEESANELGCSFCGRGIHDLERLIRGRDVGICNNCVIVFAAAVKDGGALPFGTSIRDEAGVACGFCGQEPGVIPAVLVRSGAAICPECLRACRDLVDGVRAR